MDTIKVRIEERGNGFPDVGRYIPGDGVLYRVESTDGLIHTSQHPGRGNYIYAEVSEADWDDCDDNDVFCGGVDVETVPDLDDEVQS